MNPIYLDYNATTPIDKEVAETMKPFLDELFGNPSSSHEYGIQAKKAIMAARGQVAELIGCSAEEIIFTSGGSESNNLAIKGVAFAHRNRGNHIITSSIEHPAVTEVCRYLEKNGFIISYLPVDEYGIVHPESVRKAITPETILITIMHANNETGTIQPVESIGEMAKSHDILFHTDAAQSVGKINVDVNELKVDLLSIAGHKLYAPKGIGALYVRNGVKIEKLIHGADHEMNLRAGTENILEVSGLGKACEIAKRDMKKNGLHMRNMRDKLHNEICESIPFVKLNGHPEYRLPNTLSLAFRGMEANTLLSELAEIAASAGAACHTEKIDISSVLRAMKIPEEYAMGTIRFSTGKYTTEDEIDKATEIIVSAVKRLSAIETKEILTIEQSDEVKLTHYTHGLGCACKIRPQYLEKILKDFPLPTDTNVLVSLNTSDDAAVYRINSSTAIVQTIDFFTPVVDDPYHFGAIAAANALSDIYAMGAKPVFALNIVGFPDKRLPMSVLQSILKGANDKTAEAGISILGGHTVEDTEPKYGMAVTGIIHPARIMSNSNAKPGDALVLTKPIGTGIISTAVKRGLADKKMEVLAIEIMSMLNKEAARIMSQFPVNACTDVTGFGLLGHLREMTVASHADAEVYHENVPVIEGVREMAAGNMIPGGTVNNLDYVSDVVIWSDRITQIEKFILCDAQTSGGLLMSVPQKDAEGLVKELWSSGLKDAAIIGRIVNTGVGKIFV